MVRLLSVIRIAPFFALIVFLSACSAEQEIQLSSDGAGTGRLEIRLDPVFAAYLADVSAGLGGEEDAPLFDVDAVRTAFSQRPGIDLLSIESPERTRLTLEVGFDSVEDILALEGQSLTRFLRFERTEAFRRVAAEIDRKAIEHFTSLSGIDPFVIESILPPDPEMSRREYQDHLAWALEEYAEDRPLELVFSESRVVTDLVIQGEVLRVINGRVTDEGVHFDTSLVDAVVVKEPIQYSLVFSP